MVAKGATAAAPALTPAPKLPEALLPLLSEVDLLVSAATASPLSIPLAPGPVWP